MSTTDRIRKTANFYSTFLQVEWRNFIWPLVRHRFEKPVFIVGCSRSGTTVVYKILSMAKGLASLQKESHDFWNSLHPPEERNWDSHRIPYLFELFPDAIFIYVKRDGRDNINSLIHGWSRPDEFGGWSHNLPANIQIDNSKYTRWCFFVFPGWRSYIKASIETVCAQQWITANQSVLSFRGAGSDTGWIEVFYEDILSRPLETFRELYERLDIPFTDDVKEHCKNLLNNPYNAFSPPRLNKWKEENRERIERIIPTIQETMMKMGYRI
jgi:hypothetical protein